MDSFSNPSSLFLPLPIFLTKAAATSYGRRTSTPTPSPSLARAWIHQGRRRSPARGGRRPAASLTHLGTRRSERACVSTRGRYGDPLVCDLHGRQVDPRHRPGHGPPWIHHLGRPPLRGAAYASASLHSHLLRPPIRRWLFAPACGCFLPRMGSDLRLIIILILMWCGASCIPLFSSSCSSLRTC